MKWNGNRLRRRTGPEAALSLRHWHEGDMDAGWAVGDLSPVLSPKPLPFEPTHWRPLPPESKP
jgi:hypothetical protein